MDANGHEAKRNSYASICVYSRFEIPSPRLIIHEWTLMDANQSENLFVCLRICSWFWKYELSGKGFTARFIRGSANEGSDTRSVGHLLIDARLARPDHRARAQVRRYPVRNGKCRCKRWRRRRS